ncbi:CxxH/CxxC protein, BA_5709 family [Seinonella peptonophila]|uniref:CxxH/CxxC protein, BA_5709 family n=1 Tax=Seinonella peptonophila TaxID=112248 RepID=A0A1M4WXC9_9BACL|nr:CxxH/CxxC protein [Seinonella peptonophila]SHE85850.1 CxxH/CxxC protein, BA_5709 family [Seinonella peptonophila]
MNKKLYTCEEHIEIALDEFVDQLTLAPEMEKITSPNEKCFFCQQQARYLLSICEEGESDAHSTDHSR